MFPSYLSDIKDNCGTGILADIKNRPSRKMTTDAIGALARMMHRGAVAADGKTGDGCGFLFSIPQKFMRKVAEINGVELPERYAVAMLFLDNRDQQTKFTEYCECNDLKVLFFRQVPTNEEALGDQAKASLPEIWQVFVAPNSLVATQRFRALLYLTRKEISAFYANEEQFYVASFSDQVVSYKGLLMPTRIKDFYPDLQDEDFAISFALFHQRFSTNTLPRWRLAQPFRNLAHNGEINSIRANRFNVEVLLEQMESNVFSADELQRLQPILEKDMSDSASVDNMLEFLLVNGMDFFQAARSMVPIPWQNAPYLDAKIRAFYEYVSCNFEAWDGPAALNMTDGRYLGCVIDRNGLRPAKYTITYDHRILISSEYGIVDFPNEQIKEQGRLKSGQMIAVDTKSGKVFKHKEINNYLKELHPYNRWLNAGCTYLMQDIGRVFMDHNDYEYPNLVEMQRYHNYTNEVVEQIILPMSQKAKEVTGSMGDDTPLACFSEVQRNFTDFFRQKFAQVTNPPIDPIREKTVMSTSITIGAKTNIFKDSPQNAHRIKVMSPILPKEKLDLLRDYGTLGHERFDPAYRYRSFSTAFQGDLQQALYQLGAEVLKAVQQDDIRTVLLDDRDLSPDHKLIPMAMVVGYLNQHLRKNDLRSQVSLIAITGEAFDSHSCAVLLGFGVSAIYPYLLYATIVDALHRKGEPKVLEKRLATRNAQKAINAGLLKIMSKMGIATIESYQNSALFDVIGLSSQIVADCFPASRALIPGLDYPAIELRIHQAHKTAYRKNYIKTLYPLEVGSFYKYAVKGEYHDFSPQVSQTVRRVAKNGGTADYAELQTLINKRGLRMIRDFFELDSPNESIDLSEVEPVEAITRRFCSAAMSLGSISPEAHEAIAEAMNQLGGMSNSGEGGEDKKRFGTNRNSKIKQVASGRFGVSPAYLRSAEEIQIKVAQGAKPGEGGQLPGFKVSPMIAELRCTVPGVTLISPPPHHDIYSIEDLAQLIFDLKQVNPKAQVCVKLVSSAGVGTIAVGVAKAYADKIIISGADGGTGAAQLGSIKFAGNPWEIGLSEAHNALKMNDLRDKVELQTDGGLKTGLDVVKAAILGAESFAFGTVILNTIGCKILRVCHLNKCSVGIATQDERLRTYYVGTVKGIVNYLTSVAKEVRQILADLGYRSLDEVIGKTSLLAVVNDERAKTFDFNELLFEASGDNIRKVAYQEPFDKSTFEKGVVEEVREVLEGHVENITIHRKIRNINRSFGARLSGEIAARFGDKGLPKESISIKLSGYSGQSLGAFLSQGMLIELTGTANDYVGKGMSGGHIVIKSHDLESNFSLAGNTCLYGATGGKLFVTGKVGERFAVRNSGALAVVEGTGDHPCEYMTGGTVVILGETGYNFGAGMTGGVAFVYDKKRKFMDKINPELINIQRIDTDEGDEGRHYLKNILQSYLRRTGSSKAKFILDNFREELRHFQMVTSKDMNAPLNPMEGD
ncbi:MAG: glutamate synthase large subunit [Bacteroidota bacterium]